MYKRGSFDLAFSSGDNYSVMQAYADTKLYQALFSERLGEEGIRAFAFNPGTFSSAIYRSQKSWFRGMYKFAAPFMVTADKVAISLMKILVKDQFIIGKVISKNGRENSVNKFNSIQKERFWRKVEDQLEKYPPA